MATATGTGAAGMGDMSGMGTAIIATVMATAMGTATATATVMATTAIATERPRG